LISKSTRPCVDVLIPVRNQQRFIVPCLESVRVQTLQPNSVIVVDDGSTDGTPELLDEYAKRWPAVRVIRSLPRGVSHARNLGLAASDAPFVAFLDSDDVWMPEKLERQMALFSPDRPQLGFVHCGYIQIDKLGLPLPGAPSVLPSKRGDIFQAMIADFYHISGSATAVVARRELVQKVRGFDETLLCGEDQDLWQKLAQISHVDFVPAKLVGLRVHSESSYAQMVSSNPELVLFQRLKIWSRWVDQLVDRITVLETFRREAVSVGVANVLKRRPEFGLYGRLKRSDLALAKGLFSGRLDYLQVAARMSVTYDRLKSIARARIIFRNKGLLRLCQMFGRLRDVS
jgi:glycosyltransferase involved in cell wall biosynthesis